MKRLSILGSTGSIGENTLRVVDAFPDRLSVGALAAGSNIEVLAEQVRKYRPEIVSVKTLQDARELEERIGTACDVIHGADGLNRVATHDDVDMVVSGLVGAVGLEPTYAAVSLGRDVALANKEALVVAGQHMTRRATETGARIIPVDSEHNALHQCLRGEEHVEVRRLWLTASGGPFRDLDAGQLEQVTAEQALRHPTWKMGPKITVDSATLVNKGLEVIEARWLFDIEPARISVVVHPQSVVHSMVEFVDGSFKAQLGVTDMRHPIQYALSLPERWESDLRSFDPVAVGPLVFEQPDRERFPGLGLAYRALELGGAAPAVFNAANEVAVEAFLAGKASFTRIPEVISATLEMHAGDDSSTLEEVRAADTNARRAATQFLSEGVRS